MPVILDGKKLRDELLEGLKAKLASYTVMPKLVVIHLLQSTRHSHLKASVRYIFPPEFIK